MIYVFFFKQKTAYEVRISDWSSDVCSSDLFPIPYSLFPAPTVRDGAKCRFHRIRATDMQYPEWIWHNGTIKPWAEATTHAMSHALHYGSSVFEGIRSYDTPDGPAIFRLSDHNRRLFASARIHDMAIPYSLDEINAACRAVLQENTLGKAYLRPVAWRGLGGFGLSAETPIDVAVAAWQMGAYLGEGVLEQGIDACVSSWQRMAPNTIPTGAKAGGYYLSGQLLAREARRLGFGDGIALAPTGLLTTAAGANIFPRPEERD